MPKTPKENIPQVLTPLSMAILLALADGDLHGYALLQAIEEQTGGELSPGTGSLYTALQRLSEESLIIESPDLPRHDEDQRRRYYRITAEGRSAVSVEARRMAQVVALAEQRNLFPAARGGA